MALPYPDEDKPGLWGAKNTNFVMEVPVMIIQVV